MSKRIENNIEAKISEDRFGLRKEHGYLPTSEAMLALRTIVIEKIIRKDKPT